MDRNGTVVCLLGPTASGKTDCALRLAQEFPCDLVSVDSALVYRGMDIGTAKPDVQILRRTPHRLIDILEPEETYSAGRFVKDAIKEIETILSAGRVPLLVGGTMLYFRALIDGIADLPEADEEVRRRIDDAALERGWPALHSELGHVDPRAAARIAPNDRQRIQRALEVYRVSGRSLSEWQSAATPRAHFNFQSFGLRDARRETLHRRIDQRFQQMIEGGFVAEVERLMERPGLSRSNSSMRAVGYRQLWAHLADEISLEEAITRGQAATRQLAKRQLTWLRSMPKIPTFDPLDAGANAAISAWLKEKIEKYAVIG